MSPNWFDDNVLKSFIFSQKIDAVFLSGKKGIFADYVETYVDE